MLAAKGNIEARKNAKEFTDPTVLKLLSEDINDLPKIPGMAERPTNKPVINNTRIKPKTSFELRKTCVIKKKKPAKTKVAKKLEETTNGHPQKLAYL